MYFFHNFFNFFNKSYRKYFPLSIKSRKRLQAFSARENIIFLAEKFFTKIHYDVLFLCQKEKGTKKD